jgi:hypothetical protein
VDGLGEVDFLVELKSGGGHGVGEGGREALCEVFVLFAAAQDIDESPLFLVGFLLLLETMSSTMRSERMNLEHT